MSKTSTVVFPELCSERLWVRVPLLDDAPALHAFHLRNDAFFRPFSPPPPRDFYTLEHWQRYVERARDTFSRGLECRTCLFLCENGALIGKANLSQIVRGPFQACYLGYAIDQAYEGQGLMREGLELLIDYAFGTLKLHRIMANYLPTNTRSGGLLCRLGFVVEGYARDYLMIDGRWQDHILTSLTNPQSLSTLIG